MKAEMLTQEHRDLVKNCQSPGFTTLLQEKSFNFTIKVAGYMHWEPFPMMRVT
ncbi:uncharacterized protein METZ01_LOCUS370854 [marine metagenome]|uniref:Uncharacterized protein n=1 Tax=marine metagenome TaxID=408172 RepID=A0A382T782_9ZZZZ